MNQVIAILVQILSSPVVQAALVGVCAKLVALTPLAKQSSRVLHTLDAASVVTNALTGFLGSVASAVRGDTHPSASK